jgi:amino acid transporter
MATAAPITEAASQGLRRELGLASTTAAVIGGIIAVGIFLTPAGMAKALGSPMWLLVVFIRFSAGFIRWTTWLKLALLAFLTIWLGFCLPAGIVVELCTDRQHL